jgi:hypothetical protein
LEDIDYVCPKIHLWIKECNCNLNNSNLHNLPTRLIDVGPADGSALPRLQIMNGYNPPACSEGQFPPWSYLTLSYCWGRQDAAVGTTRENIQDRTQYILINSLPKTIQDAITITRKMGFRFLWVDVLCIIQPTPLNNSDWVQESVRMCDYYKGSVFTIAAATASDSIEGCLFERKGLRFPQRSCLLPLFTESQFLVSDAEGNGFFKRKGHLFPPPTNRSFRVPYSKVEGTDLHDHLIQATILTTTFSALGAIGMKRTGVDPNSPIPLITFDRINPCLPSAHRAVDESPLLTRGWALQELLLSTRVVFWTKDVLYWNCCEKFVSEHGYDENRFGGYASRWGCDLQIMRNRSSWGRDSALVRWHSIIQRFASMYLSFPRDTLPAISSIAQSVQAMFPDDYLAGHWRKSLVESLAWVSLEKPGVVVEEIGHHWEPENYVAPSWSWASVSSFRRISLRFLRREFRREVELLAAATTLATADPTGMVSGGSIRLRGLMKEILFNPDLLGLYYWTEPSRKSELFFEVPMAPDLGVTCFLLGHLDFEEDEQIGRSNGILFLVLLLDPTYLVPDQYRRVGLAALSKDRWSENRGTYTMVEII